MRILIAPDKFKGCLSAREVAENIAIGLHDNFPRAQIQIMPVADGGEGTAEAICDALGGEWITTCAHDPLGREIKARYAWMAQPKLAVIDMSEAAGMWRLKPEELDPMRASTFGVGEMLLDAARHGAKEIVVGLGGSATNDGGFGMVRALGFRFLDAEGRVVESLPQLRQQDHIDRPPGMVLPKITAAADVRNPLLGEQGATRVFGPQKGADPRQIEELERALTDFADVGARNLNCDFRKVAGAGAAGGLGFALLSFCHARMRSGFEVVAETIKLDEAIQESDVVVTGEGSLDRQTLDGKAPAGVAKLARKHGKRVFAIVGKSTHDDEVESLFDKVFSLSDDSVTESDSMKRAAELVRECARTHKAVVAALMPSADSRFKQGTAVSKPPT